jgi:predicted transcriptional regulator
MRTVDIEIFRVIEKITGRISPGPTPSFNEAQVVKALEIIDTGAVGRSKLSQELGLGEGVTRTLLKHMKKEGIIKTSRQGIALSEYGKKIFSNLRSRISEYIEIPNSSLTIGPFNIAVLVRNAAHKIKKGVEQRDMAIRAGAQGATTLIFSKDNLKMPSTEENAFRNNPSIQKMLVFKLNPKENDVIIIGSGENKIKAEIGAKMAALELLKEVFNNI